MAIRPQSLSEWLEAKKTLEATREDLGPTLRHMRKSAGITQAYAAASLGVSHAYLSQVENGTKTPSERTVQEIMRMVSEGSTDGKEDDEDRTADAD